MAMKRLSGDSHDRQKRSRPDSESIPKRVIFIGGLPHDITESEIVQLGLPFGRMKNLIYARKKCQALLELSDLESAESMVQYYAERPPVVKGNKLIVNFSNYEELKTEPSPQNASAMAALKVANELMDNVEKPQTVLRIVIDNMVYPITIDILHKIFSKYGQVVRIVTYMKNNLLHAFVEYANAVVTATAKEGLNGQNIYNGCCSLRVDFSNMERLNVKFNNEKTWDYTNPNLPRGDSNMMDNAMQPDMRPSQEMRGGGRMYGDGGRMSPRDRMRDNYDIDSFNREREFDGRQVRGYSDRYVSDDVSKRGGGNYDSRRGMDDDRFVMSSGRNVDLRAEIRGHTGSRDGASRNMGMYETNMRSRSMDIRNDERGLLDLPDDMRRNMDMGDDMRRDIRPIPGDLRSSMGMSDNGRRDMVMSVNMRRNMAMPGDMRVNMRMADDMRSRDMRMPDDMRRDMRSMPDDMHGGMRGMPDDMHRDMRGMPDDMRGGMGILDDRGRHLGMADDMMRGNMDSHGMMRGMMEPDRRMRDSPMDNFSRMPGSMAMMGGGGGPMRRMDGPDDMPMRGMDRRRRFSGPDDRMSPDRMGRRMPRRDMSPPPPRFDPGDSGTVVLVSNMNEENITPDKVFALFGVYGNVLRVKILFNKKSSALIEFGDAEQAQHACNFLHNVKWRGQQLHVIPSKAKQVRLAQEGLPDAWLTKDYSDSHLKRFKTPFSRNYKNIFPPSETLHLSNIAPGTSEETLTELFSNHGRVVAFQFFRTDNRMGLIQMSSVEEAVGALVELHNHRLDNKTNLHVSFTKSTIRR